MASVEYLQKILPVLREHGVLSFKCDGIELSFSIKEIEPKVQPENPAETNTPPDLKADDLFNHDKILHWSGSGDDEPMPLTGEDRLAIP